MAARSAQSITLSHMSQDTHITLRQLQNLEEGRYSEMPGGMYNRAFIRTYCTYLGLEPADYLARYETEAGPHTEKMVRAKPSSEPVPVKSRPVPQALIWGIMLLASIVGLYFSRGWIAQVFSPYFAQPPAARIPLPPPTTPAQPKEAQAPPATKPAATPPADQAQPAATETTPQVPAEPPPGTIRLSFQVADPCWMSLTSDGTRIYSDTLQPGSTPYFDAKEQFELVLGNAGGIKLKINGKPAKPLGAPGAVIKLLINAASIPELLQKTGG